MSTCNGQRAEVLAEDYLRGKLPEAEAQSFENHYLECNACFEHVRAMQAASEVLQKSPAQVLVARPTFRPPAWAAFALASAAVLILAIFVHWNGRNSQERQSIAQHAPVQTPKQQSTSALPQQSPTPEATQSKPTLELASLADRTLPPFHPTQVRGAEDEHFEAGMRAYVAENCKGALDELKRVPRTSARADAAALYSAACNYHLHNLASARATLVALASDQDSPLSEAARYLLAQIELAQNDLGPAKHWLNDTIALHGDYEARAREQLKKLTALASR
ncbi:MAG TPA: hypothetical protein VF786_03325 [Terriglobales bacterium]